MVRRDDDGYLVGTADENPESRRDDLAGESPASGSTRAPSSRPAAKEEIPTVEAGYHKRASQRELISEERVREPQHQVKPAASKEKQSEGRASHVMGKATSTPGVLEHGVDFGGVEGAARVQRSSGNTRPSATLRRYIPKADGKQRPLGIPTVRDRVVQMAAKLVLEPVFEADFLPCSYGYRPGRSALMAKETLRKLGKTNHHVLDADIRDYFGSIDHDKLMKLVAMRISDRRVLKLIRQWLEAGVMDEGELRSTTTGVPQGGVYPEATQYRSPESPPASRVREIRKHGFYGGRMETRATREGK